MAALLSTRFRRWLVLIVGVPVATWLLDRAGDALERRKATRGSRAVREVSDWLRVLRGGRRRHRRRA